MRIAMLQPLSKWKAAPLFIDCFQRLHEPLLESGCGTDATEFDTRLEHSVLDPGVRETLSPEANRSILYGVRRYERVLESGFRRSVWAHPF